MLTPILLAVLTQAGVQLYDEGLPKGQAARLNCVGSGVSCYIDAGWGELRVGAVPLVVSPPLFLDGGVLFNADTCTGPSCNIGPVGYFTDAGYFSNGSVLVKSGAADSSGAVALVVDTTTTWASTGATIVSFRNHGTEEAYVLRNGTFFTLGDIYAQAYRPSTGSASLNLVGQTSTGTEPGTYVKIAAFPDLVNASSNIACFGDNYGATGSGFVPKACVDLEGVITMPQAKVGMGGISTDGGIVVNRPHGNSPGIQVIAAYPDIAFQINGGSMRMVDTVGFCFGGYESCFSPQGMQASAQGHGVNATQAQNITDGLGVNAGITDSAYSPDAGAVVFRVGNSDPNTFVKLVQVCTSASSSTCTEKANIDGTGQLSLDAGIGLYGLIDSKVASGSDAVKLLDGAVLNFSTSDSAAKLYRNQADTVASYSSFKVGRDELAWTGAPNITFSDNGDVRRGHLKFTLPYTAFTAAACTQTIQVATLPVGAMVTGAWMETTVDYNSGHMNLSLGINTSLADFLTATDMRFPLVRGLADSELGTNFTRATRIQGGLIESWTGAVNLSVGASNCGFAGGNFGNGTVTNYAQGSTTFWVTYELIK